jgi:putative ABC transport system permease protein
VLQTPEKRLWRDGQAIAFTEVMAHVLDDLRFAMRSMWKRPGFAALVISALAICIGANTAIFSIVDAVLLRQLPFRQPQRLVVVSEELSTVMAGAIPYSAPDYEELKRRNHSFENLGIFHDRHFELSGVKDPERVQGLRMSASLFPTLGIGPAIGRNFTEDEDRKGQKVAILSAELWRSKFGGDPGAIGKSVVLDRVPYEVVGVMPHDMPFPLRGPRFNSEPADVFVPISFTKEEREGFGTMYNHSVIARLRPGVTPTQAEADVRHVAKDLYTSLYPSYLRTIGFRLSAEIAPLREYVTGSVQPILLVLFGAVGFVLLIGCADVASLLLTRGTARKREMSIRVAMGASRGNLITQVFIESITLALIGGAAGVMLASWVTGLLVKACGLDLPLTSAVQLDGRVMLFSAVLSIATAILSGIFPAIQTGHVDVNDALREGGRGQTGSRRQNYTLSAIVTAQFAFALVLLTGAGLLMRSFGKLLETDPGFRPDHVLTMSLSVPASAYQQGSQVRDFFRRVMESVRSVPGIEVAALATSLPLSIDEHRMFSVNGQMPQTLAIPRSVAQIWVKGDFFHAMGIPLKRGRFLDDRDGEHTGAVAVIGETMAKRFWPSGDPIGKQIKWGVAGSASTWMTIVGVVGDVKPEGLDRQTEPETYTPYEQVSDEDLADNLTGEKRSLEVVVRTAADPTAEIEALRERIRAIDPSIPIANVTTMQATLEDSVGSQRFHTILLGSFAGVALLLAALGIAGVLAFSVAQRVPEIGVRLALGAHKSDVLKLVIFRGMRLAVLGAGIGLVCSLFLMRLITGVLYMTSPNDIVTFLFAPAVLCGVALLAVVIPARGAARIDPIQALRVE